LKTADHHDAAYLGYQGDAETAKQASKHQLREDV